ncbi:hypothetical protein [Roseisolibacter agri]|uniref:Outer-membrane lipoprotein LolB n=1 Tax=Roseisolibacter agri TaxID=2014610 RepID=A0AA37Q4U8_9BACT|nr:hypothetical protein [Roseisolibacter agri]GLC26614.1 hypothetical protein rosag_31270 [Roseisolibacter agri]
MTRSRAIALATLALTGAASCAPRARPLAGAVVPRVALPSTTLSTRPQRVVFRWRYDEAEGFSARGEGVARLVSPDSGRLDFFVDGGLGGGYAILIGDRVTAPGGEMVRRLIPPAPLLWAALGRLALPAAPDTTVRASGDTLRADVGRDPTWRATFIGARLARLERIDGGRIQEWMQRDSSVVRYRHEGERRGLSLDVQRTESVDGFPASIWPR